MRQQVITWANVDPDTCCHMVPLGHNDLTHWGWNKIKNILQTFSKAYILTKIIQLWFKFQVCSWGSKWHELRLGSGNDLSHVPSLNQWYPCSLTCYVSSVLNELTHWGQDKMDAISQTTFSNAFSWMKMYECRLRFHWSLFLGFELTIFQHWFR